MKKSYFERSRRAFTLVELLVVIAIISILATAVTVSTGSARVRSRDARRLADLKSIFTALEMYNDANGSYPNSGGNWDGIYTCWGDSSGEGNPNGWIAGLVPTYMQSLPRDPKFHTDCNGQYIYLSNGTDFKLIAHDVEDVQNTINKSPSLKDPMRPTWAYGYWSPGAVAW